MQDAVQVFEQIRRATRTLRRLPPVNAQPRFCNWPEIVRSFYEVWREGETAPPRIGVTAMQITELDEVIRWMAWLSQHPTWGKKYTDVIWSKASGVSFRAYARKAGKSDRTCREWFRLGIYAIVYAVDEGRIK